MSTQRDALSIRILFAFVLAGLLLVSDSYATTLRRLSLDDLVAHADTIAVGTCQKIETVWLDRKVYTIATIGVSQSLKGNAGSGGAA